MLSSKPSCVSASLSRTILIKDALSTEGVEHLQQPQKYDTLTLFHLAPAIWKQFIFHGNAPSGLDLVCKMEDNRLHVGRKETL